jgi:hypothetical protein
MVSQIEAEGGVFNEKWLQYKRLPDTARLFTEFAQVQIDEVM